MDFKHQRWDDFPGFAEPAEDNLSQYQRCGRDEVCLEAAVGPHEEDPGWAFSNR